MKAWKESAQEIRPADIIGGIAAAGLLWGSAWLAILIFG